MSGLTKNKEWSAADITADGRSTSTQLRYRVPLEKDVQAPPNERWWAQQYSQALLSLYRRTPRGNQPESAPLTPLYVHNTSMVEHKVSALATGLTNLCGSQGLTAIARSGDAGVRLWYAIKANNDPFLLQTLYRLGVGFECVSLQEVAYIFELFPGLRKLGCVRTTLQKPPQPQYARVLFTPNFADVREFAAVLSGFGACSCSDDSRCCPVEVTVDNAQVLWDHVDVFTGRNVILRIDPGDGRGHHSHVKTAGYLSKFGIRPATLQRVRSPPSDQKQNRAVTLSSLVAESAEVGSTGATTTEVGGEEKSGVTLLQWMQQHDVHVVGLHIHRGSGIDIQSTWKENAAFMWNVVSSKEVPAPKPTKGPTNREKTSRTALLDRTRFPHLRFLNCGGGLPIAYRPKDTDLNLQAVDASLRGFTPDTLDGVFLCLEPGRFLSAEAGLLLCHVTQLKMKSGRLFVGVNTGMNALIRPALYQAYHHIVNLSSTARARTGKQERPGESSESKEGAVVVCDVVGPICETGDVLARQILLPSDTQVGDVLCVCCAGAYGRTMASAYNMRAVPISVAVQTDSKAQAVGSSVKGTSAK